MNKILEQYVSRVRQDLQDSINTDPNVTIGEVIDDVIGKLEFPGMDAGADTFYLNMTQEAFSHLGLYEKREERVADYLASEKQQQ